MKKTQTTKNIFFISEKYQKYEKIRKILKIEVLFDFEAGLHQSTVTHLIYAKSNISKKETRWKNRRPEEVS